MSVQTPSDPLLDYDAQFLACREQHDWPIGDPQQDHWRDELDGRRLLGWRRTMMCRRCHSIATDTMDPSGVFRRSVRYVKGYTIGQDRGRVYRPQVRLERVRRIRDESAAG